LQRIPLVVTLCAFLTLPNLIFVCVQGETAEQRALRQQLKFAEARRAFDLRRMLNLEPPAGSEAEPLPFRQKQEKQRKADAEQDAAAARANAAASARSRFVLPAFFRHETPAAPYTAAERAQAMQHLLDVEAQHRPKCEALCLPGMQPRTWGTDVQAAAKGTLSAEHVASPAALLAHHYRRYAKLVHPDKCSSDVRQTAQRAFQILQNAYEALLQLV